MNTNLIEKFIREYFDKIENIKYTLIGEGRSSNDNYIIETASDKYILRIYSKSKSIEKANLEIDFMNYLQRNNFPVPKIIPNIENEYLINLEDRIGILQEFVSGTSVKAYDEENTFTIGKTLAQMHKLSLEFLKENKSLIREINEVTVEMNEINLAKIQDERILTLLESASKFVIALSPETKFGVIHRDFNRSNLLFDESNNIVAVLDFDDLVYGTLVEDIGAIFWGLIRNVYYKKANNAVLKSFLEGYKSIFGFIPDEDKLLDFVKLRNYNFAAYDFKLDGPGFDSVEETFELFRYLEVYK